MPLVAFFPVILSASTFSIHFWAHPNWPDILLFLVRVIGYGPAVFIGSLACSLLATAINVSSKGSDGTIAELRPWVACAIVSYGLVPVYGMILAKLITKGYHERYVIPGTIAIALLASYGLFRAAPQRTVIPGLTLLLTLICFLYNTRNILDGNTREVQRLDVVVQTLANTGDKPIVITESDLLQKLSFYAPRSLVRRIAYLAEPDYSIQYLNQDTIDRGLLALRPWFPINVMTMRDYILLHPSFLIFGSDNDWNWFTHRLPHLGRSVQLQERLGERLLFFAKDISAKGLRDLGPQPPSLYATEKFENLSQRLCEFYFGRDYCVAAEPRQKK